MRLNIILASALLAAATGQAQVFTEAKGGIIDYSRADLAPRKTCDSMAKFKAKEIAEIHAVLVPTSAAAPEHCRVTGTLSPEVAFEVSLPAKWNGRYYMIGNGGHAGENMEDAGRVSQRNAALAMGFAFAQTNTGHDSRKEPGASFVMSNPQKAIDYAYRAVHLTAVTTKDITKDYYGKAVSKAYWNSCSNGGRQGMIEAQRYPGTGRQAGLHRLQQAAYLLRLHADGPLEFGNIEAPRLCGCDALLGGEGQPCEPTQVRGEEGLTAPLGTKEQQRKPNAKRK